MKRILLFLFLIAGSAGAFTNLDRAKVAMVPYRHMTVQTDGRINIIHRNPTGTYTWRIYSSTNYGGAWTLTQTSASYGLFGAYAGVTVEFNNSNSIIANDTTYTFNQFSGASYENAWIAKSYNGARIDCDSAGTSDYYYLAVNSDTLLTGGGVPALGFDANGYLIATTRNTGPNDASQGGDTTIAWTIGSGLRVSTNAWTAVDTIKAATVGLSWNGCIVAPVYNGIVGFNPSQDKMYFYDGTAIDSIGNDIMGAGSVLGSSVNNVSLVTRSSTDSAVFILLQSGNGDTLKCITGRLRGTTGAYSWAGLQKYVIMASAAATGADSLPGGSGKTVDVYRSCITGGISSDGTDLFAAFKVCPDSGKYDTTSVMYRVLTVAADTISATSADTLWSTFRDDTLRHIEFPVNPMTKTGDSVRAVIAYFHDGTADGDGISNDDSLAVDTAMVRTGAAAPPVGVRNKTLIPLSYIEPPIILERFASVMMWRREW